MKRLLVILLLISGFACAETTISYHIKEAKRYARAIVVLVETEKATYVLGCSTTDRRCRMVDDGKYNFVTLPDGTACFFTEDLTTLDSACPYQYWIHHVTYKK